MYLWIYPSAMGVQELNCMYYMYYASSYWCVLYCHPMGVQEPLRANAHHKEHAKNTHVQHLSLLQGQQATQTWNMKPEPPWGPTNNTNNTHVQHLSLLKGLPFSAGLFNCFRARQIHHEELSTILCQCVRARAHTHTCTVHYGGVYIWHVSSSSHVQCTMKACTYDMYAPPHYIWHVSSSSHVQCTRRRVHMTCMLLLTTYDMYPPPQMYRALFGVYLGFLFGAVLTVCLLERQDEYRVRPWWRLAYEEEDTCHMRRIHIECEGDDASQAKGGETKMMQCQCNREDTCHIWGGGYMSYETKMMQCQCNREDTCHVWGGGYMHVIWGGGYMHIKSKR